MRLTPLLSKVLLALSHLSRPRTLPRALPALHGRLRPLPLRSMSGIPFLGALFGSSSSSSGDSKMSYPDQRTPDEWRAVLNKGAHSGASSPFPGQVATRRVWPWLTLPRRAVPHPPGKGHGAARVGQVRQALSGGGRLHVRRLPRAALQGDAQVQVWVRVAGLL